MHLHYINVCMDDANFKFALSTQGVINVLSSPVLKSSSFLTIHAVFLEIFTLKTGLVSSVTLCIFSRQITSEICEPTPFIDYID